MLVFFNTGQYSGSVNKTTHQELYKIRMCSCSEPSRVQCRSPIWPRLAGVRECYADHSTRHNAADVIRVEIATIAVGRRTRTQSRRGRRSHQVIHKVCSDVLAGHRLAVSVASTGMGTWWEGEGQSGSLAGIAAASDGTLKGPDWTTGGDVHIQTGSIKTKKENNTNAYD